MKSPFPRAARAPKSAVKQSFLAQIRTTVRGYLVRGLLVLVPLGITAYVLWLVYMLTAGHLAPFIRQHLLHIPSAAVAPLSVLLFLIILYLTGFTAAWVVGRRLIALGETILHRIPLVKSVYTASKQAVEMLSAQGKEAGYKAAVFIDFPFPGARTMAFVTGKSEVEGVGPHYRVFVPTTPNPTSGYLLLLPPEHVKDSGLSVEEAAKCIMSAGVVTPALLAAQPVENLSTPLESTSLAEGYVAPSAPEEKEPATFGALMRKRLVSGFLVLVPLGITALLMNLLYEFTAGRITPLAERLAGPLHPIWTPILSVILFVAILYSVGYIATAFVGVRLIHLAERVIERIPVATTIYSASKQIMEAVFGGTGPSFKAAVLVSFPYPGAWALGFLMGSMEVRDDETHYKVFLPTVPNVTVGLLQFFRADDIRACNLTVEEAVKTAVSCGLVGPPNVALTPVTEISDAVLPRKQAGVKGTK